MIHTKFEFLEFFDNEKIIDEEAGQIEYSLLVAPDFLFTLYVGLYDDFASVTFSYNKWPMPIFDIGLERIDKIELDRKKQDYVMLNFYKEEGFEPVLSVMLKPTVQLQYSIKV